MFFVVSGTENHSISESEKDLQKRIESSYCGRMTTTELPTTLDEATRLRVQTRVLRTLTFSQMIGSGAVTVAITIGAFVIQDILGESTAWAGIASASTTLGGAILAQGLSRLMARRGRRPGLQLGYAIGVVGALCAAYGAETETLPIFLCGVAMFGGGQASNLLARYVATDLALPEERGRAMSQVVFASSFGAILGPLMAGPAQRAGETWFGFGPYTGPWLFGGLLFVVGVVHITIWLRPDPLVITGSISRGVARVRSIPMREALRVIGARPRATLAIGAMAVSQATMAAVMTMTPVHMKMHGNEDIALYVVSLHIAGMYAFSPLVGRFADRRGNLEAVIVGASLIVLAGIASAVAGEGAGLLFPALWLLGIGWSFGLIGGSGLLIDSVPTVARISVQGTADLLMVASGSLAGFSSGFIRQGFGYGSLALFASTVAALLVVLSARQFRTERADQGIPAIAE
jgi:MFS family permease